MRNTLARVDSVGVWLPRVTYHRQSDNRRVELIGMAHIADRHFYNDVIARLDKADANHETVCFEGIKPLGDDERALLNPTQLSATTTLRVFMRNIYLLMGNLGLAKQTDLITVRDNWVRTDLDELAFLRQLGASSISKLNAINKVFELAPPGVIGDSIDRDKLIDSFGSQPFLRTLLVGLLIDRDTILHHRDAIGAQGILAQTALGRDVVATWGNAHLPGIGRILTTSGFEPAGTSDHLAISRDTLTEIDQIQYLDGNEGGTTP